MGKGNEGNAGISSKVAKFIDKPTPVALDGLNQASSSNSRRALKEMAERKRRNDFVLKREFDMLRKIRRKGKPEDVLETMELTSSYTSSQLAHSNEKPEGDNQREQTLRKINEIEAQLSRSWFRKGEAAMRPGGRPTVSPSSTNAAGLAPASAVHSRPMGAGGAGGQPSRLDHSSFLSTQEISEQPDLPVLTQTYQPRSARGAAKTKAATLPSVASPPPPPQKKPASARPPQSPNWGEDPSLDGLNVKDTASDTDWRQFTALRAEPTPRPAAVPATRPAAPAAARASAPQSPANSKRPSRPAAQAQRDGSGSADDDFGIEFSGSAMLEEDDRLREPAVSPPPPVQSAATYGNELAGHIEVMTLRNDQEIEEAAIAFANGDEAAAEATLRKLVDSSSRRQEVNVWLTLFDFYRVTGNAEAFDSLVPEFTASFGRSAPQWERAAGEGHASSAPNPLLQTTREGAFAWASPSQFNARAVTALTNAVKRTVPPWRIDWRYIKSVEPDVLSELGALFTQWADARTQIQFLGGEHLLEVLAGQLPAGDKSVTPAWWNARLGLLRLMNEPDRFDQAALDYCITYEISPPAWVAPKGSYTELNADGESPVVSSSTEDAEATSTFQHSITSSELLTSVGVSRSVLEGEILGSAAEVLAKLPHHLERVQAIELDSRALRRVDFGAAGELLNWAIEQRGQGRSVTFLNVHRLLAAFFGVMGINTAAQVVLRKD